MNFEFDPNKSAANFILRGLPFNLVEEEFDFAEAVIVEDDRKQYGEPRYRAFGELRGKLHCVVFVTRGRTFRVISLRRANKREEKRYGEQKA